MAMSSWLEVSAHSDFSIYNIPFGVYSDENVEHHACTRIGDYIVDLYELAKLEYLTSDKLNKLYEVGGNENYLFFLNDLAEAEGLIALNDQYFIEIFNQPTLNHFISLGKYYTSEVRNVIQKIFTDENHPIKQDENALNKCIKNVRTHRIRMLKPIQIGDYTDFYSSEYHATNVGKMFRDPNNALLPNWKHLPVGYHGRSSSIFVSPHSFYRPHGQIKPADADKPTFGPTKLLDFELETAFVIGKATQQGEIISVDNARDYIFGMLLFNDWSARDIQTWEYQPLGPFLAKNFASTISPWIVTLEALEPFFIEPDFEQIPEPLPYLHQRNRKLLDINLEVILRTPDGSETLICQSNNKYLYWTMEQQLAHHTINGCPVNIGDLMASGTISGPEPHQFGSMLELTWKGTKPLKLKNGEERKFIQDNDTIIIRGYAERNNIRVGFGECIATVLPARKLELD